MAKKVIDFDPALAELTDWLLGWDSSANGGNGGTRRFSVASLAPAMAGDGLQGYEGKIMLGGTIGGSGLSINTTMLYATQVQTLGEDNSGVYSYLSNYLGASSFGIGAGGFQYITFAGLDGYDTRVALVAEDTANNTKAEVRLDYEGFIDIEGVQTNISGANGFGFFDSVGVSFKAYSFENNVNSDFEVSAEDGNIYMKATQRVLSETVLQYVNDESAVFDSEDDVLPTAGWVRSKLPAPGTYLERNTTNSLTPGEYTSLIMAGPNDFNIFGGFTVDFTAPVSGHNAFFGVEGDANDSQITISNRGAEQLFEANGDIRIKPFNDGTLFLGGLYSSLWVSTGANSEFFGSFSNNFGQSSGFDFWPDSFSIGSADGPDIAGIYGAVGVLQLSFSDSAVFSGSNVNSTIGFESLSNLGSSKAATGSASAPTSYLGNPAYWLGRPADFIRVLVDGNPRFIPCYS